MVLDLSYVENDTVRGKVAFRYQDRRVATVSRRTAPYQRTIHAGHERIGRGVSQPK